MLRRCRTPRVALPALFERSNCSLTRLHAQCFSASARHARSKNAETDEAPTESSSLEEAMRKEADVARELDEDPGTAFQSEQAGRPTTQEGDDNGNQAQAWERQKMEAWGFGDEMHEGLREDDLTASIFTRMTEGISLAAAMSGPRDLENRRRRAAWEPEREADEDIPIKAATDRGYGWGSGRPRTSYRVTWEAKDSIVASALEYKAEPTDQSSIPRLAHGLDRVLFNPGVYHLRDPRSRVYNFDPALEKNTPIEEFNFDVIHPYVASSKDPILAEKAREHGSKYVGSTSSLTTALSHFHFLVSQWRPLHYPALSRAFQEVLPTFTRWTRLPTSIYLRWRDGKYAIDMEADREEGTILTWLGQAMEKRLTHSKEDFSKFAKFNTQIPDGTIKTEKYRYSTMGNFLLRSQLDARDPRLPGTGVFDLKSRAVVAVRMDPFNYATSSGYQIRLDHGDWESFEKEYYDMARSALLKYSLQARIGVMDGIFVAYHNIERIFGFQYVSLSEMDSILHGTADSRIGDQEFKVSMQLLGTILDRATEEFPEQSLRITFETRDLVINYMSIFAEPISEEEIDRLQAAERQLELDYFRKIVNSATGKKSNNEAQESTTPETDPELGEHSDTVTDGKRVLALSLYIQNRVNGELVDRPTILGPNDEWIVEYDLGRPEAEERSTLLYEQCQKRKAKRPAFINLEGMDEMSGRNEAFVNLLRDYATRGRDWRHKQDLLDALKPPIVFEPWDKSAP